MPDKNRDTVTREVLEKASKDMLQEVSEHLYNYVPYTDEEIAEIFDLDEVTAKALSKVINDEYIAKNKVFSNEHTIELLNQTLADANKFTAEQIANSGNLKRKIVTSTSEVVDETILYLILTDSTNNIYTQYMLIDGVVTSLSTTQINLRDYLLLSDFNTEIDKYAKNGIFHRAKVRILRHKQATLKSVLVSQMNTIMSFTNHNANKFRADGKKKPIVTKGSILKGAAQNPKFAMDIVGGPKGAMEVQKTLKPITDITDEIERTQKRMKREAKRNKKDLNDFRSFIGFKSKKSNSDDLV